jgi:DNA-binding response OmpR family regulator
MAAGKPHRKRVIILEPDPDLADSIRVYLEDSYQVYVVQDPAQIMQYMANFKINLLVTDLDISHPDIQRHLNEARVFNPNLKILVMYMFIDEDNILAKSILNDVDDYIFKPFNADVLRHKLDRLVKH